MAWNGRKMEVRGERWKEGGAYEVSTLESGRTLPFYGMADGRSWDDGDQPATGTAPEHALAGAWAQPLAARRGLPGAPGAGAHAGATQPQPAQPALWKGGTGPGGSPA